MPDGFIPRAPPAGPRSFASLGYALPGAVIAVGVLIPLSALDHWMGPALARLTGRPVGLLLTGSAVGLLFAYTVRFLAVSLQSVDASLARIAPSLDDAARSLGAGRAERCGACISPAPGRSRRRRGPRLRGDHEGRCRPRSCSGPFGLNTLAMEVWERTNEALWQEAAVPALAIVLAGLVPVIVVIRWSNTTRG